MCELTSQSTKPKDDMLKVGIDSANGAEGKAPAATPKAVSKANHELIGMISVVGVAKMLDDADGPALRAQNLVAVGGRKEAAKLAFPYVHGPQDRNRIGQRRSHPTVQPVGHSASETAGGRARSARRRRR